MKDHPRNYCSPCELQQTLLDAGTVKRKGDALACQAPKQKQALPGGRIPGDGNQPAGMEQRPRMGD